MTLVLKIVIIIKIIKNAKINTRAKSMGFKFAKLSLRN